MNYYQKSKKSRGILSLCILIVMIFIMSGCDTKSKELEIDEAAYEERLNYLIYSISRSTEGPAAELFKTLDKEELDSAFKQSGEPVTAEAFLNALDGYSQILDETGNFQKVLSIELTPDEDEVHAVMVCKFEKRQVKVNAVFNKKGLVKILSFSPEYSLGEIAKKAGMNTLIGMGTVFVILAFIAFVISLLKYLPNTEAKKQKEAPSQTDKETSVSDDLVQDEVLVAVISAAIAEYEQLPNDEGFVVRSIVRRKDNRW